MAACASGLCSDDVRGCDHPGARLQTVAAATNLVAAAEGGSCGPVALPLLHVLLQLRSFEAEPPVASGARAAIEHLAVACGSPSAEALVGSHSRALVERVCIDHESWASGSGNLAVLGSLMHGADAASLAALLPGLMPVLAGCLDPERDPAMRLSLLRLLDTLLEDPGRRPAFLGEMGALVLVRLLVPCCIWKVGKVAAAVRFSACVAMVTLVRQALVPPEALAKLMFTPEALALLFQLLEEDFYSDTRLAACQLAEQLLLQCGGMLDDEQRRKVYPELLKRLDDSSNAVRVACCGAIQAFARTSVPLYDDTNTGYLVAGMLIHMDDMAHEVQEAVCRAIEDIARSKPAVVTQEVNKVKDKHRVSVYCDRCLDAARKGGQR